MAFQNNSELVNYLESNRQNTDLNLAYAKLSEDGVTEVAKFVRDNPFVKYLDVRGNSLQGKGAVSLANGIKVNRSLRGLTLKWNLIGHDPSGISALCDALRSNLTILHVDLRNNRINNLGAKYISEMLKSNTTITHLDVSWNDFGVDGGMSMLDALKRNSTLVECQLSGSKVGEDILNEVAFLLRRNRETASRNARPKDTGAQEASDGNQPADLPMGASADFASTTASFRTNRTKKDDSSLMLRIMMKEREQFLQEDKLLFEQIVQHIDSCLKESVVHKQGRREAEEREKLAAAGFIDREQRYAHEIRTCEENLIGCLADKEILETDVAKLSFDLKTLHEEKAIAIKELKLAQEKAAAEEQELRADLRGIIQEKHDLQDKLALGNSDLELLEEENERLRVHVDRFEKDVNAILA